MPQDTPTTAAVAIPEPFTGYFPPDLAMSLDDALDSAVTVTLRRVKPGKRKVVHREQLMLAGKVVAHGTRTDRNHEEIAAQLYALADDDATSECNCNALYVVVLAYAKPPAGRTAANREIELQIGTTFETTEQQQRHDFISMLLADRRELFAQHINLMKAISGVHTSTSSMADSMAKAFVNIHNAQSEVAQQSDARAMASLQMQQDAQRLATFNALVGEVMPMVRAKMGIAEPPKADLPPMVMVARKLALSLRPEQMQLALQCAPCLQRAVTTSTEAELLALVVELLRIPEEQIDPLLRSLSGEQQSMFEQIVLWANSQTSQRTP